MKQFSFKLTTEPYKTIKEEADYSPVRLCLRCNHFFPLVHFSALPRIEIVKGFYYSNYWCGRCHWLGHVYFRYVTNAMSQIHPHQEVDRFSPRLDLMRNFLEKGIEERLREYSWSRYWSDWPLLDHFRPFLGLAEEAGFETHQMTYFLAQYKGD